MTTGPDHVDTLPVARTAPTVTAYRLEEATTNFGDTTFPGDAVTTLRWTLPVRRFFSLTVYRVTRVVLDVPDGACNATVKVECVRAIATARATVGAGAR